MKTTVEIQLPNYDLEFIWDDEKRGAESVEGIAVYQGDTQYIPTEVEAAALKEKCIQVAAALVEEGYKATDKRELLINLADGTIDSTDSTLLPPHGTLQ